jgi:enterochelin esterase family protein
LGTTQVSASEEQVENPTPDIHPDRVVFRLPDPVMSMAEVNLIQEIRRPRLGPPFEFDGSDWVLTVPRPNADRIEYMLHLRHRDGGEETIPDPNNPVVAPGPFGYKSVIEWSGYAPPDWVAADAPSGDLVDTSIRSRTLRSDLRTIVWASPGASVDDSLPLLVAHDGPEYAEFSGLIKCLEVAHHEGRIPSMRAALVAPVERNETLSASAAYARALAYEILPGIEKLANVPHGRSMRIGMGASLGGLSMLHLHRHSPAAFGALFLQSGSFFRQRYDKQESSFPRFRRISRFMGRVLTAEDWPHPIPVMMTCGTIEENLWNNRATRDALARQGYEVALHENRDGHNWIGWRDTFDPYLIDLIARMWA